MDFGALIKRAFSLTLGQRRLWILGLAATSGSLAAGILWRITLQSGLPKWLVNGEWADYLNAGSLTGLVLATIMVGLLFWFIGAVAEGGLICGVASLERGERLTIPGLVQAGFNLLGRFVAIDTILFLPLFLLLLAMVIVLTAGMIGLVAVATRPGSDLADMFLVAGLAGLLASPLLLATIPVSVAILFLRLVAFRTAALEQRSGADSIRQAWCLLRQTPGSIISLGLLLWGIGYVISIPVRAVTLPVFLISLVALLGAMPAGITAHELPGWLPATAGVLIVVLDGILNTLLHTFGSTAWTEAFLLWSGESN